MNYNFNLIAIETPRIMRKATKYLAATARTITTFPCVRSAGDKHDFYSQGDYWWPDPKNAAGSYIRRDGFTNPDNFVKHRQAMVRLSEIVGAMASAYIITGQNTYILHALRHLRAWFIDDESKMNPRLLYGQAIKGRCTGRGIGIIDTIHLVEVVRATLIMSHSAAFPTDEFAQVKAWFKSYLIWLNTHPYGQEERSYPNNHGVCWSLQAAAFAELVGDKQQLKWVREQFKTVYLPEMMSAEGGFPAELARSKPYGYSLFMIDVMAGVAQIASIPGDDLWSYRLADGRSMQKGLDFIFPYIEDKTKWPGEPDVLYWDKWPVRQPSLLFAGLRFHKSEYLQLWERLEADPQTPEVVRTLPLRHPLLWIAQNENHGVMVSNT